jgi:broad specificity phosphatase PhoE
MFVLHLKDIQAYLAKTPQGRPRETAKALTGNFGSPLLIETNMLDTDANTIKSFLEKYIREIKS